MRPIRAIASRGAAAALIIASLALVAGAVSARSAEAQTPTATPSSNRTVELAPIDDVEVQVLKSQPPQYQVLVTSGLPSGCASFDSISHRRSGTRIDITVRNVMDVPPGGACTTIYGMVRNTVQLGSDFQAGTTYTVVVNAGADRSLTRTFTADGVTPPPAATPTPAPATPPASPPARVTPPAGAPQPANVGTGGVPETGTRVEALDAIIGGGAAVAAALVLMVVVLRVPRRPR